MHDIETPSVPLNILVRGVQLSAPSRLSVSWDPPDNSKNFDLDHFKVHILQPEQGSYIAKGTSTEPEYHFHSDSVMVPPQNSMHVAVTAVSKCSLSGPFAIELIPEGNDEAVFTSAHNIDVSKTESGPEEYDYNIMTNGKEKVSNGYTLIFPSYFQKVTRKCFLMSTEV